VQLARVDIFEHRAYGHEVISTGPDGVQFGFDTVDTTRVVAERKFLLLKHVRSRIILGPTDDRLDEPRETMLDGRCIVIEDTSCVLPLEADEARLLSSAD
jgi:hypothetical protein